MHVKHVTSKILLSHISHSLISFISEINFLFDKKKPIIKVNSIPLWDFIFERRDAIIKPLNEINLLRREREREACNKNQTGMKILKFRLD